MEAEKKEEQEAIEVTEKENEVTTGGKIGTRLKRWWWLFLLAVFFFLIWPASFFFSFSSRDFFSGFLKRLPYPAAYVRGAGWVTSRELLSAFDSVKIFYASQDFAAQGLRIDFSTQDGKDRLKIKERDILDKLVEDEIIQALALERGITITAEEAEKDILEKVNKVGNSQSLSLNLKQNYGWSIGDFRDKVVIPQLYLKRLMEWHAENDQVAQESRQKIKEIESQLSDDGKNFSELAKKYSEGESASAGGDLGWFKKDELVSEVGEKVFSMKPGEISGFIESSLGWHLVLLDEEKEEEENGQKIKKVKIRQIFLRKGGFLEWLTKEKSQFDVLVFIKDYRWEKGFSKIDFSSQSMRSREADLRIKSEGDPIF